ncbi:MAG: cytochrome c maturation protein CcmE [Gammaproteobacteria bacterium]|nr:MAG: cytochrome c maturation protein CcmE [Gammaproteobacteria bacterium]
MNPKRKQRMLIILFVLGGVGIAIGLALYALSQNINLFYSPSQIAAGEAPKDTLIRVGGMVEEGSVERHKDSLKVQFNVTDFQHTITVRYEGILPDLFREGQGIVAMGRLRDDGTIEAQEVLAKHDEKYMPPEVQRALDKAEAAKAGE